MEFTIEQILAEARKELLEWKEEEQFTDSDYERIGFIIAVTKRLEKISNGKEPQ